MDPQASQSSGTLPYEDLKGGYELRSNLSEITDGLQVYEEIAIIFLSCETPRSGLLIMEKVLAEPDATRRKNLFYKWLINRTMFITENWRDKLAELLTIIQNYKLARILGFLNKDHLVQKFKPKNNLLTYRVSAIRKALYNLCEDLTSEESNHLIAIIEGSQDAAASLENEYFEYKLLNWNERGIINIDNKKSIELQALLKSLESLSLKNFIQDIEIIVEKTNCQNLRNSHNAKLDSQLTDYYEIINKQKLGLCVIINQKIFTTNLLTKRWGTDKDAERLIEVFTAFSFDVKLHSNIPYKQLMSILRFYAKTVNVASSYFVLIILSHGSENVIFTSDSIPVDMNTIEMIFQAEYCPNLIRKPKIFIVQSCQGQRWQKIVEDSKPEVETDDTAASLPKQQGTLGPQKGDSMIAWSTVQGFASFRDRIHGSWYIQELCSALWKFGDCFDLVEILTKVNNNLRSKVYGSQFMVPSLLLSLRAKVQLPHFQENFSKGRKLMLERLIFEKVFENFLATHYLELGALLNKSWKIKFYTTT